MGLGLDGTHLRPQLGWPRVHKHDITLEYRETAPCRIRGSGQCQTEDFNDTVVEPSVAVQGCHAVRIDTNFTRWNPRYWTGVRGAGARGAGAPDTGSGAPPRLLSRGGVRDSRGGFRDSTLAPETLVRICSVAAYWRTKLAYCHLVLFWRSTLLALRGASEGTRPACIFAPGGRLRAPYPPRRRRPYPSAELDRSRQGEAVFGRGAAASSPPSCEIPQPRSW